MIRSVLIAASGIFIAFAASAEEVMTLEQVAAAAKDGIEFVDSGYILERQSNNADLMLVDVRSGADYEVGHIPGAISMPRGTAEFEFAKNVRDANTEIILYCRTGSRASLVKKALSAQGYTNVSVHSGFETWAENGHPIENKFGSFRQDASKNENTVTVSK